MSKKDKYHHNYTRPGSLIPLPETMELPPSQVKDPNEQSLKPVIFAPEHRDYVRRMVGEGRSPMMIAKALGVTHRMLRYRCYKEIEEGSLVAEQRGLGRYKKSRINITDRERHQVQIMASKGLGPTDMCQIMGYAYKTFIAYFQEDVELGRSLGKEKVVTAAFDMATDREHATITKFWLESQLGWRSTTQIEFPDENGLPQSITGPGITVNLNAEKIQAIVGLLNDMV
jgi:hypothetical protein